jgi:hypothetical protein
VRAAVPAGRPGPGGPAGQRLRAIGRIAALRQRITALGERTAALRERTAALRERTAALRERTAALGERIATPGQGRAAIPVVVTDRSPPRQIPATPPEQTAAPGERVTGRWHRLVAIGHADVS